MKEEVILNQAQAVPRPRIARAWSSATDPARITTDLTVGIAGSDPSLIAVFVSASLPYQDIIAPISAAFPDVTVVGCTTAGSLTPDCYVAGGAVAVAFDRATFSFETCVLTDLRSYSVVHGREAIETAYYHLLRSLEPDQTNLFAMLLVDGLSRREEEIAASAYAALDEVPVFGASAGNNLHYDSTQIFHNGRLLDDAAMVVIGASSRPVEVFKLEHFQPTDRKVVITRADTDKRVVWTIDAEPAAEEYARLLGVTPKDLTPELFAANPLLMRIGGEYHVRAIQKVDADGGLNFFCAVEEGAVLTRATPEHMRENLEQNITQLEERLGELDLVLCFDCILRRVEAERLGLQSELLPVFRKYNMIGFNTYGEQYRSLHLSQTLTGLAIGSGP